MNERSKEQGKGNNNIKGGRETDRFLPVALPMIPMTKENG